MFLKPPYSIRRTLTTALNFIDLSTHTINQIHQQQSRNHLPQTQLISLLNTSTTSVSHLKQIHAQIYRNVLHNSCFLLTKLIRTLTKLDIPIDSSYPQTLFHQVENPNPFLYTALIRGYSLQGFIKECVFQYSCMRNRGIRPLSFTFTALFKACISVKDVSLGMQIHAHTVLVGGFDSDLYVGNTLIDMYVNCGVLEFARKMFDEMSVRDVISWTSLIFAYAKNGDMELARELFEAFPEKDMVAWTAMVTGFAKNSQPGEALRYFETMQGLGVEGDEVTLVVIISACAQLGALKYANWVREIAENWGIGPMGNVVVGSALIDMYSKCGSVEDAYNVFTAMKERNVYTYSSMIAGFAMHGHPHAALQLFQQMVRKNTKPNTVTFVGVLTACSHGGMVEQGRELFAAMKEIYEVAPNADHYACMVDLLGRAGKLEEALRLANTMPVEPHGGVWGALLGACHIHGDPDIAQVAANHLFELEPNGIGNYILLSNIYASSGRWGDVSRVRKLMRGKGLKKNPGCSWFEVKKGEIHEFVAGDITHPKSHEIKEVLEDILERLMARRYKPVLSSVPYDICDDDKKRILMAHSEKLAFAFGLLSTDAGCMIRIVKNLRICDDCHSFMCGASEVTGREIVVRDNMRFHRFHNGLCSCGNFW